MVGEVLPAGLVGAVLDAGQQWSDRFRSEASRSTRWAHLGLTELQRGQVGGHKWLPWALGEGLNPADCQRLPEYLERWGELLDQLTAEGVVAPWTAYNSWMAARSWHRWAQGRHGFGLPCDPYADVDTSHWAFLSPETLREVDPLTPEELGALIRAADHLEASPVARRRAEALIAVLGATGCRISEAAGMQRDRLHLRHDSASGTVRYVGKRRKWHRDDLPTWACKSLRRYFYARQDACQHLTGREPVFGSLHPPRAVWRPMHRASLAAIVGQVAEVANLEKRVTPHLIRGALATEALGKFSPYETKAFTGHSTISSLEHYDYRQRGRAVGEYLHARVEAGIRGA